MPSSHAGDCGYVLRKTKELQSAERMNSIGVGASKRKHIQEHKQIGTNGHSQAFPAPLVLPGDDLALDPKWPPQPVQKWASLAARNEVTPARSTVYLCGPPSVTKDVNFMNAWVWPRTEAKGTRRLSVKTDEILKYVAAFYTGLEVQAIDTKLSFVDWDAPKKRKRTTQRPLPTYVGLRTDTEIFGVRVRDCPDKAFPAQLNLNDILDVLISIVPADAYAVVMIVHQDIFEDADDDYCCGRAYGGSRVAVVSSARYNPNFDADEGVDQLHIWPASHCAEYVENLCQEEDAGKHRKRVPRVTDRDVSCSAEQSPLRAAIEAAEHDDTDSEKDSLQSLWLGRVCKTVSHELGHCFGIDHCVYYACVMQGTASLAEDARQPPYLCPVDTQKILTATGSSLQEHYVALKKFCDEQKHVKLFAAFSGWLEARLLELSNEDGKRTNTTNKKMKLNEKRIVIDLT